jgi:hypothetical protein
MRSWAHEIPFLYYTPRGLVARDASIRCAQMKNHLGQPPLRILALLALLSGAFMAKSFGETDTDRFEQIAHHSTHFSLAVIVKNRELRVLTTASDTSKRWDYKNDPYVSEQVRLLQDLRSLSGDRNALAALLKDSDPKVRTLALGAIFQREDGRDLPLIASLLDDSAVTLPDLRDSMNSIGGPQPLAAYESSQTVGSVADAMLAFWCLPEGSIQTKVTTNDFARYWSQHAGRTESAGWFVPRMNRATRQTIPIRPDYQQPDIDRVLAKMQSLPEPYRAWVRLYVLAPQGWYQYPEGWDQNRPRDEVATDDQLLEMVRQLPPDSLLRFLQGKPVSDDPDLLMDRNDPRYRRMRDFILRHADRLLRPEDADAVLAAEYVEKNSGRISDSWGIGAALLEPQRASEILHKLLDHEPRDNWIDDQSSIVVGSLWRICGPSELGFLVNWFYTAKMQQVFLLQAESAHRPDTTLLLTALIKDARFDQTKVESLVEMLTLANASRPIPLVKGADINAGSFERDALSTTLPKWRNLLRQEFAPAKTSPNTP